MIGDKVRSARVRNLEKINDKRHRQLDERGVTDPLQAPEDIAIYNSGRSSEKYKSGDPRNRGHKSRESARYGR
jgi:hypothetical protein